MQLSVEISKYPLADNYLEAIKDFIHRLNQYSGITVQTNVMSTQVFGDYDKLMEVITKELKVSYQQFGTCVFVCKFIPDNLLAKYSN